MESFFVLFLIILFVVSIIMEVIEWVGKIKARSKTGGGKPELIRSGNKKSYYSHRSIQLESSKALSKINIINLITNFDTDNCQNFTSSEYLSESQTRMKQYFILGITQRSDEWLKWRNEGIGASDAPVIMGESPWKTSRSLLKEKLFGESEWRNEKMIRGIELEPKALELYQKITGIKMRPVCIQSKIFPWLRASLDGLSYDENRVVEIKCGESVYKKTYYSKQVPFYYYGQLQHILAITGLSSIDFWCFLPNRPYIHLIIKRDDSYIDRLLKAENDFWNKLNILKRQLH